MALQLADRVLQTGTANTTVSFSLTGSVVGFQAFSAITTGNTLYYSATDGTNWETGLGTLTSSTLLTRTTVSQSSNSNTAVTFVGTVTVWVDYPSKYSVIASTGSGPIDVGTSASVQLGSLGVGTAASGTTGEIRATNNVTAYYSSDRNLKTNIKPISAALQKVEYIGGKTFSWNDDYLETHGGEDGYFIQKNDFGVIAQDVQSVFPIAVRTREDGTLAVDYPKLVALAFQAIAELKAEIDALKGK